MFYIFAILFGFCSIFYSLYNLTILYSIGVMIQTEGFSTPTLNLFVGSFIQNSCIAILLLVLAHISSGIAKLLESQ